MTTIQQDLLNDLISKTEAFLHTLETEIAPLPAQQLNWKPAADSWSILECLQHLNLYGVFYLPEIRKAIAKGTKVKPGQVFKSGLLGNYFALSMAPKNGEIKNKMKTFKDKEPANSQLPPNVLETFRAQQKEFLQLLKESAAINLNTTRTPITITRLIRLKLGDTFRFVIYHHERHMVQVENVLKGLRKN